MAIIAYHPSADQTQSSSRRFHTARRRRRGRGIRLLEFLFPSFSALNAFDLRYDSDRIAYTEDVSTGLAIQIVSGQVGDMWSFSYYDPTGTLRVYCEIFSAPGQWNNTSANIALASNCAPAPHVLQEFPAGCPCSPLPFAGHVVLGNNPALAEQLVGTSIARVDYKTIDEQKNITLVSPNVASTTFVLRKPPAILLIHGWRRSCSGMDSLADALRWDRHTACQSVLL